MALMKFKSLLVILIIARAVSVYATETPSGIPNPLIDYRAHRADVEKVEGIRETRRLSEEAFLRAAREPDTILLDARSGPMFERLHIEGALNLSFPDFTEDELAKIIPSKNTRVLIYCNNNFLGSPKAMPTKRAEISLNISTFVALYAYGYTNVYELGPLLRVQSTRLPMVGSEITAAKNLKGLQ